jgi:hypothetical protein
LKGAVKESYLATLAGYGGNLRCANAIAELRIRVDEFESTLERAYDTAACWNSVDKEQRTLRNISDASDAIWDAIKDVETCSASTPVLTIQDGTSQPQERLRVEDLGPSLARAFLSDAAEAPLHIAGLFEGVGCAAAHRGLNVSTLHF